VVPAGHEHKIHLRFPSIRLMKSSVIGLLLSFANVLVVEGDMANRSRRQLQVRALDMSPCSVPTRSKSILSTRAWQRHSKPHSKLTETRRSQQQERRLVLVSDWVSDWMNVQMRQLRPDCRERALVPVSVTILTRSEGERFANAMELWASDSMNDRLRMKLQYYRYKYARASDFKNASAGKRSQMLKVVDEVALDFIGGMIQSAPSKSHWFVRLLRRDQVNTGIMQLRRAEGSDGILAYTWQMSYARWGHCCDQSCFQMQEALNLWRTWRDVILESKLHIMSPAWKLVHYAEVRGGVHLSDSSWSLMQVLRLHNHLYHRLWHWTRTGIKVNCSSKAASLKRSSAGPKLRAPFMGMLAVWFYTSKGEQYLVSGLKASWMSGLVARWDRCRPSRPFSWHRVSLPSPYPSPQAEQPFLFEPQATSRSHAVSRSRALIVRDSY